jgi:hypothetical protein
MQLALSDLIHSPRRWTISAIRAHRTARVDVKRPFLIETPKAASGRKSGDRPARLEGRCSARGRSAGRWTARDNLPDFTARVGPASATSPSFPQTISCSRRDRIWALSSGAEYNCHGPTRLALGLASDIGGRSRSTVSTAISRPRTWATSCTGSWGASVIGSTSLSTTS